MVNKVKIFCAGLIGWDTIGRTNLAIKKGDDLPGSVETTLGGVIINIAIALTKFVQNKIDLEVIILSSIGNDPKSDALLLALSEHKNINCKHVIREIGSTDGYLAIESRDGLFGAIASSTQIEKSCTKIFAPLINQQIPTINSMFKDFVMVDSNLTTKTINFLTNNPFFDQTPFIITCASPFKAKKIRSLMIKRKCTIYANLEEASQILGVKTTCSSEAAEELFRLGAREAIVTNGKEKTSSRSINGLATNIPKKTMISKITGAGDTFLATHFISKILNKELSDQKRLKIGADSAQKAITYVTKETND